LPRVAASPRSSRCLNQDIDALKSIIYPMTSHGSSPTLFASWMLGFQTLRRFSFVGLSKRLRLIREFGTGRWFKAFKR